MTRYFQTYSLALILALISWSTVAQTVDFQVGTSSTSEGTATHFIVLQLSAGGPLVAQFTVDVVDAGGGSATSATDYSAIGTVSLTFPIGADNLATQVLSLNPTQDSVVEGDESLNLRLTNAIGGSLGALTDHVVTIVDDDSASVAFQSISALTGLEDGAGTHTVVVELSTTGGSTLDSAVVLSLSDLFTGTASSGADYTALGIPTQLTFAAGSATGDTQSFVIPITVDATVEGNEHINVNIFNISGPASIGSIDTQAVIIEDDDGAFVSIQDPLVSVGETGGAADIVVELSIPTGPTPTVSPFTIRVINLFSGNATFGSDYTAAFLTTLTFPTGSADGATQVVPLTITDDSLGESDETINHRLYSQTGDGGIGVVTASATLQTVTILDDEVTTVSFQGASSSTGESTGTYELILELGVDSGGNAQDAITIFVVDQLSGAAISDTDYGALALPEVATFPAGSADGSTQVVNITIINDGDIELGEAINLNIFSVNGSGATAGTADHAVTIIDNDGGSSVEFLSGSSSITESNTTHQVIVKLNAGTALASDLTVDLTDLFTGSASSATDYSSLAIPVQITFASGSTDGATQVVNIPILADASPEADETISLQLGNPQSPLILASLTNHVVTIDNDDIPIVSLNAASSSVIEASTTHDVVLTLTIGGGGLLGTPVTVEIADLATGSAASATDYSALPSPVTLTFPVGAATGATQVVPVSILADTLLEGDETIDLRLSNPLGADAILGAQTNHVVTITDDETGSLQFANSASSAAENGGTHQVIVTLTSSGTLATALTVDASDLLSGSAASATDYGALAAPVQLTFPSGAGNGATQVVSISVTDDALAEFAETIDLRLSNAASPLTIGSTTNHSATITDDDSATLAFSTGTSSVGEANATQNVVVTLSVAGGGSLSTQVTVTATDIGGTASSGTDYTAFGPLAITFAVGAADGSTQVAPIAILDDTVAEFDETITLRLSGVTGPAALGSSSNHSTTITDDETATLAFQTGSSSAAEAVGTHFVIVELSVSGGGSIGSAVTLDSTDLLSGSAISATDYSALASPTTLTFNSGSTDGATQRISIVVTSDTLGEGDETLNLRLSNASSLTALGSSTNHTTTLIDDEPPTITFANSASNSGTESGTHNLSVKLVVPGGGTLANQATVDISDLLTGSASSATDYTALASPVTVTFAAGSADCATQVVAIAISADTLVEGDETVDLRLSNASGSGITLDGTSNHTATIADDDSATIDFQVSSSAAAENGGTHNLVITLTTGGTLATQAVVSITDLLTGSATSGTDYVALAIPVQLTFAAGSGGGSTQIVPFGITDDLAVEGSETINLRISSLTGGATLGSTTNHIVSIADDESSSIGFQSGTSSILETAGTHSIVLLLSAPGGPLGSNATIDILDLGTGSASVSSDYSAFSPIQVTFTAGSTDGTTQVINITVLDDALAEGSETINLNVANPVNTVLGSTANHVVTITDDEGTPTFAFQSASSSTINEATLAHSIVVSLSLASGTLANAITVDMNDLLTGSATSAVDYTAVASPVQVTFAAGSANGAAQIATVTVTQDLAVEANETVNLRLSNPGTGTLGATTNHAMTITEDDSVNVVYSTPTSSVAEATTTHNVIVSLVVLGGGNLEVALSVDVNDVLSGTATSGADYTALAAPLTLNFPIGASNGSIQVVPIGILADALIENDETLDLALSNPSGSPVFSLGAQTSHQVTITNDDGSATVDFQSATSSILEAGGTQSIVVVLSTPGGNLGSDVIVNVTDLLTGTASSGGDYTALAVPAQITFSSGSASGATAILGVGILDDGSTEGNEDIDLQITGVSGPGGLGSALVHALSIIDDDGNFLAFQTTTSNTAEIAGTHFVVVELIRPGGGTNASPLSVDVTDLLTGTATSATDYTALAIPVTVTFAAGVGNGATAVVPIGLINDVNFEANESINLRMSNIVSLDGVVLGSPTNHSVIVVDDDNLSVTKTASVATATIGETFTYTALITVPEGSITSVIAADTLPNNINFQAGTLAVVLGNGGMSTSFVNEATSASYADPVLTITFGTINNPINGNTADDSITVTFDAIVANSAANNAGDTKTNSFSITNGLVVGADTADVGIVEGNISLTKAVENITRCSNPATGPIAGDSLQYTLSITETQGQPAYDLTISDVLSEFMLYDASFTPTVSGAGNTIGAATVSGSGGGGDPQTLSWNLGLGNADIDIAAGGNIVITYRVTVSGAISGGAGINNTATVGFSSIDGISAGERSDGSAPGSDDYVETDSLVLSVRTAGTQFTIPASRRRNPTFIDANGIITGPGSPGTLDADDELVLTNGSGITLTGDGISGPPPAGAPDITVNASASAIINTDGTNTFAYGIVTINTGASLTLTGDSTFTMEQIVMAAGSTLTLAAGTNLTVTGPCELNGGVGTSNYVTVQASGAGNYSINFNCSFLGDHFRFNDVGTGKITFNGDSQMDFAIFADGSGGPYVCYCADDDVTWTNLAFGYGNGTAQSIETCGIGNVIVDGYASTITNVWIGGDATEIEGGGTITWSNATPVRKLTGSAFADSAGGVRVEFRTEGESAISHFEVQRDRKTVGRVHSTAAEYEGADYNFHDHSAEPGVEYSYRIQAMDTNGTHRWHPLGKAEGGRLEAEGGKREESISRSAFNLQPSSFSVTIPNYQPATYASDTPVQTGSGHRATVRRSGLYRAPAAMYNLGTSLAHIDDFVFVRELRDFYSDENVVFSGNFQTVGTAGVIPDPEPDGYLMGNQYIGRFRSDANEAFSVNAHFPAGPNWFAREIITSEASLEVDVDVRSPQAGEATIVASIRGNTDGDHDLSIELNGTLVGSASWSGQGFRLVEITCDASLLTSGTNSVALRTSQSASSQRLDYIEICTPASPALQNGGLLVRISSSGTLSVPGATHVIDVTTFGAETEANANFATGQLIYFADRIQTLNWEPVALAVPTVAESANYLIVAPQAWLADFAKLAELREASSISIEDVRDIYGGGIFGPAGLVRLSKRSQANYLLIGAGTTYDTRDFEGRGTATGIPTGWIQVDDGLSASDDLYSDDLRIAVGRFPARRRSEVVALTAKILDYQAPNRVTLLSDKDDSQGGVDRFAVMQRALADTVPSNLIETSDKTAQAVRAEIADSILAGARLVAYQGHGGFQELGDSWIDAEHPEQVPPAAWILSTCLTGSYFVNNESVPTLAREMLGVPNGGAVSLICSTRFGHADDEHRIVQRSLELVAEGQSLGAALRTLKQEMTGETIKVYTLLGDPALGGLDFSERRAIHLRTPQAGALIGGPDPIEIHFSLTGDGWWDETLRISWSQHGSPWTPITNVQAQPGEPDYSLQWTPPTDGKGYSIRIELAD